jgi:iron complex transport system substrate-binding protein
MTVHHMVRSVLFVMAGTPAHPAMPTNAFSRLLFTRRDTNRSTQQVSVIVLLSLLLAALLCSAARAQTRAFVDDAGRKVVLPAKIERVYVAGPPASVLVMAIAPEKLIGWTRALRADEAAFLPPRLAALPEVGRLTGRGNSANIEVVLALKPDLIIDIGSINTNFASLADRVTAETRIPYVLLDGRLDKLPEQIEKLAQILGEAQRAKPLLDYTRTSFRELRDGIARIPADRRPEVYYARGPSGLTTGLAGSINVEMLEFLGARNVAGNAGSVGTGTPLANLAQVGFEQVVLWNPPTIITNDPNFYREVWRRAEWQSLRAVRNQRVFLSPNLPFGWFDFPPGANRLIGLKWLANLLYPDTFKFDLRREIETVYSLLYQQRPTREQIDRILNEPGVLPK